MTLLIGSNSPRQVVITADGICIETQKGMQTVKATDLIKIFPIRNTTVAIAHHGENIINGRSIKQVIAAELAADSSFFEAASPAAIADRLATDLDSSVRSTLATIADAKSCAFWVCGFERGNDSPAIIEIRWQKETSGIEFKKMVAGDLFLSGDGQEFIERFTTEPIDGQFSWDKLWKGSESYHVRYHEKLWAIAQNEQAVKGKQVFGGKKIRLVITKSAWRWETAP